MYIIHICACMHTYMPHVQIMHTHISHVKSHTYTYDIVKHLVIHVLVTEAQAPLISHSSTARNTGLSYVNSMGNWAFIVKLI